jgi:hypothetical protein
METPINVLAERSIAFDTWSYGTGAVRAFIDFVRDEERLFLIYHENWKTIRTHEQKTAIPAMPEMTVRI